MSVTALQAAREPLPAGETLGQLIRQSPRGGSRALAGLVTGMGRDLPTVIIANGNHATVRDLISQYGRRMTIEQRHAECTWQGIVRPGLAMLVAAQLLVSFSAAVRPASAVRRRKSARTSRSLSSYPAQIWSIAAFMPESTR